MCSHDLSYEYFLLCDFLLDMSICIQIIELKFVKNSVKK